MPPCRPKGWKANRGRHREIERPAKNPTRASSATLTPPQNNKKEIPPHKMATKDHPEVGDLSNQQRRRSVQDRRSFCCFCERGAGRGRSFVPWFYVETYVELIHHGRRLAPDGGKLIGGRFGRESRLWEAGVQHPNHMDGGPVAIDGLGAENEASGHSHLRGIGTAHSKNPP